MLKPFYNKKKNIDNRLLPSATAADAGKVVGVTEDGNFVLVEGGSVYPEVKIKFTTQDITPVEIPARSFLGITNSDGLIFASLVTRESFILPESGKVNCTADLISLSEDPMDTNDLIIQTAYTESLETAFQAITGAIEVNSELGLYYLYDKAEISFTCAVK